MPFAKPCSISIEAFETGLAGGGRFAMCVCVCSAFIANKINIQKSAALHALHFEKNLNRSVCVQCVAVARPNTTQPNQRNDRQHKQCS